MINRRNTLLLLGVFVLAGGVVLATGAFSTVEADRTVSVDTQGDGAALLGLQANDTYNGIEGSGSSSSDALELQLVDINEDATTSFDEAVNVTNRGNQQVWLYTNDTTSAGIEFQDSNGDPITENDNAVSIPAGESVYIALEVDTTGGASGGGDIGVTFTADTEEPTWNN